MDPVLVIVVGMVALLVVCSLLVGWDPRRERQLLGPDYAAMSEIESHDVEDMLDGINERRRRAGKRDLGEELSDDFLRSTWDDD